MNQTKDLQLKDTVSLRDLVSNAPAVTRGFRTAIEVTNELGEVIHRTHNDTLIGGGLYTLEKLFGVESPLKVAYLNEIMGFGQGAIQETQIYPKNNLVCLFGIGIGGAGDTSTEVYPVDVKDRELPQMIPFRVTTTDLTESEKQKYFGMKDVAGKKSYYLKKFETTPQIKALWRDNASSDEDGSNIEPNVHESLRTEGVETFAEIVLKIDKNDGRQWFEDNGQIEKARVNSIGLFTGVPVTQADGKTEYQQVKAFSMFNIYNEMLNQAKELNIHYRIYTL